MLFSYERHQTQIVPGGVQDDPEYKFSYERDQTDLSRVIRTAIEKNPEAEVKQQADDLSTGIPMTADLTRERAIQGMVVDTPVTQRFIADPENIAVVHDDVESLSAFERLSNAFERGEYTHRLGIAGTELKVEYTPDALLRVQLLQEKLDSLGHDTQGGFVDWLGSAVEVIGQMTETFSRPQAGVLLAAGGGTGALAGLAGGPLAPVTSAVGALIGMGAGTLTHLAVDAYEVEGGLIYVELLDLGVDKDTAGLLSNGVGILNASLEMASATVLLKPLTEAGKKILSEGIRDAIKGAGMRAIAQRATLQYGAAIGAEVSTEVMQEIVNVTAEEWGKELSDLDVEEISKEELQERLTVIAEKTFKAMVFLAAPGPGMNFAIDARSASRAKKNKETLDQLKEVLEGSKLSDRVPEKVAEHTTDVLRETGIQDVSISGERLYEWIIEQENPDALLRSLGVADRIDEAIALDGDVTINAEAFAADILMSPNYESIVDHIRIDPHDMTPAEAVEFAESGIEDAMEAAGDVTEVAEITNPSMEVAETELGLKQMFRTGEEAGMTPKQYQKYLETVQRSSEDSARRQQDTLLKQEQREITTEWKENKQQVEAEVREEFSGYPAYAVLQGIGAQRLDREQTTLVLKNLDLTLKALPKQARNRNIYAAGKKEPGIDPDVLAEQYGYETAEDMFEDMVTAMPFEEAVATTVEQRMNEKFGYIRDKRNEILAARKALHNDVIAEVIEAELNALRKAQKAGRLTPAVIRRAAKELLKQYTVREINPNKFLGAEKRAAKAAAKALRKGNRAEAMQWKFKQVMNFHMAKESFKLHDRLLRQKQFLAKFNRERKAHRSIPTDYIDAIRQLLRHVQFSPFLKKANLKGLKRIANATVDPATVPTNLQDVEQQIDYRDMSLEDFQTLHNVVKEIAHKGRQENKLRLETEKRERDVVVAVLVDGVMTNLMPKKGMKDTTEQRGAWDKMKRFGEVRALLFNTDTILREIDNWVNLGPAYANLKGRYDRALSEGYQPGQIGQLRRQAQEAKRINELFSVFTEKEKLHLNDLIKVEGVKNKVSHHTILTILLNSGNEENLTALIDSKYFTKEEVKAIHNHASKRDWEFAQSVWDYFDEFWEEIKTTEQRRRNITPQRVVTTPIETDHGTFKGGYYPIRWDGEESNFFTPENIDEIIEQLKYGSFASSQTRHGHTKARTEGAGKRLLLDMFIVNSHVDQVVYDLEVGDAITDMYKILHHKEVKAAFTDVGAKYKWEQLDLWLRDVQSGEIGINSKLEKGLRWVRKGITISKLGWNVGVSALQILGTLQSAVLIGKVNMWHGLRRFLSSKWVGENSVFKFVAAQSGFMQERANTFDKEILDAKKGLNKKFFDKAVNKLGLPPEVAEFVRNSFFWGIKKNQQIVDTITWLAAKEQGMKEFDGDEVQSTRHADRMVIRAQASGIFSERTPIERGSIHKQTQQTEMVRAWSIFISYFMAKFNVAFERTGKTNFKNPGEAANWAIDMMILYTLEGMMALLIRGQWPDDEPLFVTAIKETINNVLSVPFAREAVAVAQGFKGGGSIVEFAAAVGKAGEQALQFELDAEFFKAWNDIGGIMLHYPSGQISKTARAFGKRRGGTDVDTLEYLMGPKFKRR